MNSFCLLLIQYKKIARSAFYTFGNLVFIFTEGFISVVDILFHSIYLNMILLCMMMLIIIITNQPTMFFWVHKEGEIN